MTLEVLLGWRWYLRFDFFTYVWFTSAPLLLWQSRRHSDLTLVCPCRCLWLTTLGALHARFFVLSRISGSCSACTAVAIARVPRLVPHLYPLSPLLSFGRSELHV